MAGLDRTGDCWLWTGGVNPQGYGRLSCENKAWLAHRYSFFVAHGSVPPLVMHSCDVPACCRPSHLREGTHAENTADMMAKGRNHWLQRSHCKSGHDFEVYGRMVTRSNGKRYRMCCECKRIDQKRRRSS